MCCIDEIIPDEIRQKVELQNQVNIIANKLQKELKDFLVPYIGQRVFVDIRTFLPSLKEGLLNEVWPYYIPFNVNDNSYPYQYDGEQTVDIVFNFNSLRVIVTKQQRSRDAKHWLNPKRKAEFTIAVIENGILKNTTPHCEFQTYNVDEIHKTAMEIKQLEEQIDALTEGIGLFVYKDGETKTLSEAPTRLSETP